MARTDVFASSSAVVAGSVVRGPSASAQVRAVVSLKLAKLSKKALEEKLEEKRLRRESWRSQIEKNKKEREEEKKVKAEKKPLRIVVNKPGKKSGQVVKVEAAPKEEVTPSTQLSGTAGAYQSRTQFQSRIPVPRIYWRAEVAKYEEARLARQFEKFEPKLVKKLAAKKEIGLDLFKKNEEARRVQREEMRAEREKKQKEEGEERNKEYKKKREHERRLAKEIDEGFKSVSKAIREEKKLVAKEIKSVVKNPIKPCKSIVKNTAESASTGREAAYQPQDEMDCVRFEKLYDEIKSDLLKKRELLIKKRELEETRLKRAQKEVEKSEEVIKENARKDAIVVKKGALDSESASPTGVLQKRSGFGWSECSSTDCSSVGLESDDDACKALFICSDLLLCIAVSLSASLICLDLL